MTEYDDVDLRAPDAKVRQVREHLGEQKFKQLAAALYHLTVLRDRQVAAAELAADPLDIPTILEALDDATRPGFDRTLDATEDVLRAIEREQALTEHNASEFSDPGGRPSKVDQVVAKIDRARRLYLLNEWVDEQYVQDKAVDALRAADPSRPTYYKIRDRIADDEDLPYTAADVDEWRDLAQVARP